MPDSCDFTWEPVESIMIDFPDLLEDFLYTGGNRKLKQEELSMLKQDSRSGDQIVGEM